MDYDSARVGPPSYALEEVSDNDSDWGEDHKPTPAFDADKDLPVDPLVFIKGPAEDLSSSPETGTECVFLVGEVGERFARGVRRVDEGEVVVAYEVVVDGEQVGLIQGATPTRPSLVYLTPAIPLATVNKLSHTLLKVLKPASVLILSSYHAPTYTRPSGGPSASIDGAPFVHLSTSPDQATTSLIASGVLQPFAPPNIIHGLPSSLLTFASLVHPGPEQSSSLVLLPSTAIPLPLNPPFPVQTGPDESSSANAFRDTADPGLWEAGLDRLEKLVKENAFDRWWSRAEKAGDGFEWLVKQRRDRKREYQSSMYM